MESHDDRQEIQQALAEGWGQKTRWSQTVSRELRYVAVRIGSVDDPQGVVRVAMAVRTIGARADSVERLVWTVALVILVAAILLALGLARLWSNPIRRITTIAHRLSRGDLSARAPVTGSDEVAILAKSLNDMREHLSTQLDTIDRQKRTLEALLTQLHEGVVVVGPDARIVLLNPAAARLLNVASHDSNTNPLASGATVEGCITQHEIQMMLLPESGSPMSTDPAKRGNEDPSTVPETERPPQESRLELRRNGDVISVLARAWDIALPSFESSSRRTGRSFGRLLVLTDITELAKTIQMKSDFVANASHELRTPLSAIRASVETLLTMNLAEEHQAADRFVRMVDRHSAHLEEMVADLLDLSRVETAPGTFSLRSVQLSSVIAGVRSRRAESLTAKNLSWQSDIADDAAAVTGNDQLLSLILDNLVDNAIKFTEPGGRVAVSSKRDGQAVAIEVADTGCGIPAADQERVFERFFQVERSRSGTGSESAERRGTGLGLAIVRHAAAAMQGTVRLASAPGKGTCVTVTLPVGQ